VGPSIQDPHESTGSTALGGLPRFSTGCVWGKKGPKTTKKTVDIQKWLWEPCEIYMRGLEVFIMILDD